MQNRLFLLASKLGNIFFYTRQWLIKYNHTQDFNVQNDRTKKLKKCNVRIFLGIRNSIFEILGICRRAPPSCPRKVDVNYSKLLSIL